MSIVPHLIHFGGIVGYPRDRLLRALNTDRPATGWDFLRKKYAKHFGFGLEVRGALPPCGDVYDMASCAREALQLARGRYGAMLADADVHVRAGALPPAEDLIAGYPVDLADGRDYSKPVLIDIIHDAAARSYRIGAVAYDHIIDGAPLALLVQLMHNHIVLRDDSLLARAGRSRETADRPPVPVRRGVLARERWERALAPSEESLFPVGGYLDVTDSAVVALRSRIAREIGAAVPVSSVELALAAFETGLNWASDCVAQLAPGGIHDGYRGLGFVRTSGYAQAAGLPHRAQYDWLRGVLAWASAETDRERARRGSSSLLYERYRRIPAFWVDLFDRRIAYDDVMAVAGTQLLGSNLNGVDYGVPVHVGGIPAGALRYFFIPSHSEHHRETRRARAARNLETHVTEVSLSSAPFVTMGDGRRVMYKSTKASPATARRILAGWGRDDDARRDGPAAVEALFRELYRPDRPSEGRIEQRARLLFAV